MLAISLFLAFSVTSVTSDLLLKLISINYEIKTDFRLGLEFPERSRCQKFDHQLQNSGGDGTFCRPAWFQEVRSLGEGPEGDSGMWLFPASAFASDMIAALSGLQKQKGN